MEDNLKQLRQLKENVKSQWAWVDQATAPARSAIRTATANDEDNWLRSKVRSTRLAAESALASAQEAAKSTADTVAGATSSVADSADGVKARALEIRRQNPAMLVAAVTVLAIAPAYRSGPRALFRNAIVGGTRAELRSCVRAGAALLGLAPSRVSQPLIVAPPPAAPCAQAAPLRSSCTPSSSLARLHTSTARRLTFPSTRTGLQSASD